MAGNGNTAVDIAARGKIIQRLGQMHYENAVLQGVIESQQEIIARLQAEIARRDEAQAQTVPVELQPEEAA